MPLALGELCFKSECAVQGQVLPLCSIFLSAVGTLHVSLSLCFVIIAPTRTEIIWLGPVRSMLEHKLNTLQVCSQFLNNPSSNLLVAIVNTIPRGIKL